MAALYLDRGGVELREEHGALGIYEGSERRRGIPLLLIDRVVVLANVQLNARVLRCLAGAGVPLVVIDPRDGARSASLHPRFSPDAARRIAQYRAYLNGSWRRAWSHRLLRAKLRAQIIVLERALEWRPELRKPIQDGVATVRRVLGSMVSQPEAGPGSLTGWEGAAAAAYFDAYRHVFAPSLGFQGRNRRPPRDPVNACLSLGYTLLHHLTVAALLSHGLDPFVGFYHEVAHGRESLACDLVEPLRPRLDFWVWRLFQERRLRPEHFKRHGSGCLMGKAGRRVFYEAFEETQPVWARRQRRAALALARQLREMEPKTEGADEAAVS